MSVSSDLTRQRSCASQVKFGLQDAYQHATNVTVFAQLEFPAPGVYYVEVLVDEVMKLRFPLPLAVVPPPQAPNPPTPTKAEPAE